MSTKHTPDPWIAIGWQVETEREDYPDPCSCNFDLYGQWEMTHDKNELACANAERIAACVNACAGIDNATLENFAKGFPTAWDMVRNIKQQRDELLESCESFRDSVLHQRWNLEGNGMSSDQINDVLNLFDTLVGDEIAKARGQQS